MTWWRILYSACLKNICHWLKKDILMKTEQCDPEIPSWIKLLFDKDTRENLIEYLAFKKKRMLF